MATKKQRLTVKEQRLLAIDIPETATENYLERLALNITQQFDEVENEQVKEHLQKMLQEIQARLAKLREESEAPQDIGEESPMVLAEMIKRVVGMGTDGEPITLRVPGETGGNYLAQLVERITTKLDTTTDENEKQQLQHTLLEIQRWIKKHEETPEDEHIPQQEEGAGKTLAFYDTINLSQRERSVVKNRLADILQSLEKQRETVPSSEPEIELGPELEVSEVPAEIELGPEFEVTEAPAEIELGPELEVTKAPAEIELVPKTEAQRETPAQLTEAYGELFDKICQQISKGESLDLLYDLDLSERERRLLKAFALHLTSYKGLRKQQVFDLQHLTSKSIGELEQILKTYQPQGYLNVELHNVYNRLLTLRSRLSTLLH